MENLSDTVYEISFNGIDVMVNLDQDRKEEFKKLPPEKQIELIDKHAKKIAKGLESGLMDDWCFVMSVAITNTSLEEDIREAFNEHNNN